MGQVTPEEKEGGMWVTIRWDLVCWQQEGD